MLTTLHTHVANLQETRGAAAGQISVRVSQAQQRSILSAWRMVSEEKQQQEEKLVRVMRQLLARKLTLIFATIRGMIDDNKEKLAYSLANRRVTVMSCCMTVLAGNASSRTKHGHQASRFVAQNRHRELKHTALRVLYNELLEAKSPAVHDAE